MGRLGSSRGTAVFFFFFQAEDGIRDDLVTGVQTCALPICPDDVALIHRLSREELVEFLHNKERFRSEERRWGKSVDLGGRRIIKKKKKKKKSRKEKLPPRRPRQTCQWRRSGMA